MKYTFTTLALFITLLTFSQKTRSISGHVKNLNNEELAGASVKLLSLPDSALIKSGSTSGTGKFEFLNLQNGLYLLQITNVGHKKYTSNHITIDDSHQQIVLPVIVLSTLGNNQLKEVTVTSKKPLIENDLDKTIVNVEAMISAATSNTYEILEKTPGIVITPDGSINLNGKTSVLVLIDGRATHMSGQDLAAYLKSLPGGLLDKIELMENPPSKYDAAGGAVINIKLKKNKDLGLTGNVNASFNRGVMSRMYEVLNLNYNRKKLNWFGNIGYSTDAYWNSDFYDRKYYTSSNDFRSNVIVDNERKSKSRGINGRLGLDYTLSKKTIIGWQVNVQTQPRKDWSDFSSKGYDPSMTLDSINGGNTNGTGDWRNLGANVNFLHKLNESGRELSGDLNYINYRSTGDQQFYNYTQMPGSPADPTTKFRYDQLSGIDIYNAKVDYVHPLKNKMSFEAGLKFSIVDNDNDSKYFDVTTTGDKSDLSKSNHFIYHENINAGYLNFRKNWKRFGAQVGLRAENTYLKGNQVGNAMVPQSTFSQNFTGVFPTLFLNYKLDSLGKHTLTVSVNRRINRPNYQQFNPFMNYRDNYTYSTGNPGLQPSYQYRYELRYQFKQLLTVGFSYGRGYDLILFSTEVVGDISINRPANVANATIFLLNTNLNMKPAKWWQMNLNLQAAHLEGKGTLYNIQINPSVFSARANINNQFNFKKGWSAELSGYWTAKDIQQQSISDPRTRWASGIQKKILKDKGSIRISYDDMFHLWETKENSFGLRQATFYHLGEFDSHRVGISFNWRFGNDTFARKRRHTDNAADSEKSRVE